ncbi:MAG TPA: TonB-dependent receptor [Steroidobacteraceae bacterium]|nr:TonB-dependent receptor [Steroidobacteraceae bacterium]
MNRTVHRVVHYALMSCALSALTMPAAFAHGVPANSAAAANRSAAGTSSAQAAPAKGAPKHKHASERSLLARTAPAKGAPGRASADIRLAQTVPGPANGSASSPPQVITELATVEITGTHILQSSAGASQPITSISADQILQSGYTTISSVLQNIPQSGSSLTSEAQSDSSNGDATEINLRYLGASRTLVLVNGQRWTPQLDGTVNLNAIPASMIEHIDVLQDGASAVYGSDAIAGVVNIIMKNDFNGAEVHAYTGAYDSPGHSLDGKTNEYDFAIGKSDERSGIMISGEFQSTQPVYAQNRYESANGPFTQTTYLPGFDPPTLTIQSPALANQMIGGATCTKTGVCAMQPGTGPNFDPTLGNFTSERFNTTYYPSQFMLTKQDQNESLYLNAHYKLSDNITFTTLAAYNNDDSLGQIGSAWGAGVGGAYQVNGAAYGIGANNPYNPFGVDLVGNSAQYCPNGKTLGGVAVASCTPNYLLSQFSETIPAAYDRVSRDNIDTETLRMGLNGVFRAIGSDWHWEGTFNYGRTYDTAQDTGFTNIQRLAEQLDSPGVLPCNGPAQSAPGSSGTWDNINGQYYQILIPGCVPINPFGGFNSATGQSAITPAMADWSQAVNNFITTVTMRDFSGDITGRLVNLPAGPLSVAAGGESLGEMGSEIPGNLLQECLTSLRCIQPTFGRTWTYAEYLEFNIPVLKDLPFAKALSIDLANRWSQFRWQGGTPGTPDAGFKNGTSASTGRVQVRWKPIQDLVIRGSWAQGFRAPSVSDLYNAGGASYNILQDPCAPAAQNGGWVVGTPLPAGCQGVEHSQGSTRIQTQTGGNPLLTPEKAISRTAGFEYSPHWISDLSFGADYYEIELTNEIGSVPSQYILSECYDRGSPAYCNLISLTGNTVTLIEDIEQNIGGESTSGVDIDAAYGLPPTFLGDFSVTTNWTFVRSFIEDVPSATSSSGFQSIQELGYATSTNEIPKVRGTLSLNWNKADFSATWNVTYIGKVFENCSALTLSLHECTQPATIDPTTATAGVHELNRTIYNDLAMTYDIEPIHANITLGIQNIFNTQFPLAYTAGAPPNFEGEMGYRIPGRFLYARIGVKFK